MPSVYVGLTVFGMPFTEIMVLVVVVGQMVGLLGKVQKQHQKMNLSESAYWSMKRIIEEARREEEELRPGASPLIGSGLRMEGGRLSLQELRLTAPEIEMRGEADVDLLGGKIEGQLDLLLSREDSEMMRSERSRAAEVFWDARAGQVKVPFTLSGPFDAPSAGVDFKGCPGSRKSSRFDRRE